MKKVFTLCLIRRGNEILLGMKKVRFGAGRWNGFGGKVEENETVEETCVREMLEESGIKILSYEKRGVLEFESKNREGETLEMHIFYSDKFEGEPVESDEMAPKWFNIAEIPFSDMWPSDIYWMSLFLAGKKFRGKFLFGDDDVVLEHTLEEEKMSI